MADRFLREVKRMHQLRQEEADKLIRALGDDAAEDRVFAAWETLSNMTFGLFMGGLVLLLVALYSGILLV